MNGPRRITTTHTFIAMIAAAIVAVPLATAQTSRPATTRPATAAPAAPTGLLAGPAVEPEARELLAGGFGGQQRRERAIIVPARRWFVILRELELSPQQARAARSIVQEFQKVSRQFREKHGDELKRVTDTVRAARATGRAPDDAKRARFETLQASRPTPEPYQQRIWEELTAEQRDEMSTRLEEIRREIARDRLERRRREMTEMMDADPEMNAEDGRASGRRELDERGRRRLKFLRSRQSTDGPGNGPTKAERHFEFDEDDAPPKSGSTGG